MGLFLPALLCLGLCLGQKIKAENVTLPRPQIILEHGSVILMGKPLSIRCRGPADAQIFLLLREDNANFSQTQQPIWNEAIFSFPNMTETMAGIYSCIYQAQSMWSPPSESMKLAVAGVLPKPYLSVDPKNTLASGDAMTFNCWSDIKLDRLIVYQEQGFVPPMFRLAPDSATELRFPKVNAKHQGIYSCIGFSSKEPLMWSIPSKPLVLTVSQSQDQAGEIIILIVLLGLGNLLSWTWIG